MAVLYSGKEVLPGGNMVTERLVIAFFPEGTQPATAVRDLPGA